MWRRCPNHATSYHAGNESVQVACAARSLQGTKPGLTPPRQGSVDFKCPQTATLAPVVPGPRFARVP
jgi:hypothetical protein